VRALDEAVERAAAWYHARGLEPRFHVHPAVEPASLDARLAALGWVREMGAVVQVAPVGRAPAPAGRLEAAGAPGRRWIERFAAWRELASVPLEGHVAILRRVPAPRAFAWVGEDDHPRALGLAVVDGPWVGLFDLVTDPSERRRGWGRRLVEHLLAWGRARGAEHAWLQVEERNAPALRLYDALGFRTEYSYVYRAAPPP